MCIKYLFLYEYRNKYKILYLNVLNFCLNYLIKICVILLKYMDKIFSVILRLIKGFCYF